MSKMSLIQNARKWLLKAPNLVVPGYPSEKGFEELFTPFVREYFNQKIKEQLPLSKLGI